MNFSSCHFSAPIDPTHPYLRHVHCMGTPLKANRYQPRQVPGARPCTV